jgi:hypothetical protein
MRGFLAFLFIGFVALGAGAVGYQAGLSSTAATAAAAGGASVVYVGGWHLGGLLLLPFLFLVVPLFLMSFMAFLAFVFGGRRHWAGHGPMGMHRGFGGFGAGRGPMGDGDPRRQWIADAHRRLHEDDAARPASTAGASDAGPGSGGTTPV